MMKFHALVRDNAQELAELIVKENGKNITEALADGESLWHLMPLIENPSPS
jgi:acyl-CoA reductase-like NAD-dependent aldehyde dehydrogenase